MVLCEGGARLFDPRTLADSNLNHTSDGGGYDIDWHRERPKMQRDIQEK
jgi:hypothetical protein